jgi:hypothetical protein
VTETSAHSLCARVEACGVVNGEEEGGVSGRRSEE